MGPTNDSDRFRWIFTALLGLIAAGGAIDLALDRPTMVWSFHVLFRIGLLAASTGAAAYSCLGCRGSGRKQERTLRELQALSVERDVWRTRTQKFLEGLGEEIERQLKKWWPTPPEHETMLPLLKGHGHERIAARQDESERMVRRHWAAL